MKITTKNKIKNMKHVNIPVNKDVSFPRDVYLKHRGKTENFKSSLFFINESPPEIPIYIRPPSGIPRLTLYFTFVPLTDFGL